MDHIIHTVPENPPVRTWKGIPVEYRDMDDNDPLRYDGLRLQPQRFPATAPCTACDGHGLFNGEHRIHPLFVRPTQKYVRYRCYGCGGSGWKRAEHQCRFESIGTHGERQRGWDRLLIRTIIENTTNFHL